MIGAPGQIIFKSFNMALEIRLVNLTMEIREIIKLLGTDTLSATFSPEGLKFLSLRPERGDMSINLAPSDMAEEDYLVKQVIGETLRFFETGRHEMPLDLKDFTSFQQSVFEAVRKIEPGRIITYKGIAEMLGKPGAAQAVGSAVAKNPVSYFLPTHRVLPLRGIGICRSGAGHLREKLLILEGHDLSKLKGNYVCNRKKCCME